MSSKRKPVATTGKCSTETSAASSEAKSDGRGKAPIENAIDNFVVSIAGVRETAPFIERTIIRMITTVKEDFEKERNAAGTVTEKTESFERITFPRNKASKAIAMMDSLQKIRAAKKTLPNMLLLALVSQYDAYVAYLLKALFQMRPEKIFASEKQVRFSEISEYDSIEDVKQSIVEKEVESILRQSHAKQFDILENLFGVKLKQGLDVWPDFIEITERRNLLAHTNGIVSSQYIATCRANNVPEEKLGAIGETLSFTGDYFNSTYDVLFEICLKLGHVLWRTTVPNDMRLSDIHYNQKCFELIKSGRYTLAIKMLDFMCDVVKKHSGQDLKLFMEINRCNAYRLAGDSDTCVRLLDRLDMSALGLEFKLAEAILRNEYELASTLMRQIGKEHPQIDQLAYSDWPIFERFRDDEQFLQAYEEVFGEKFTITTEIEASEVKDDK